MTNVSCLLSLLKANVTGKDCTSELSLVNTLVRINKIKVEGGWGLIVRILYICTGHYT